MDKDKVKRYIKSVGEDFKAIKFEENDGIIKFSIGNFFLTRVVSDDYEYDVKKLFEDFLTNTTSYYINNFWER